MRNLFPGKIAVFLPLLSLAFGAISMRSQSPTVVPLMPTPAKLQAGSGFLRVDEMFGLAFTGYREPRLERAGRRFLEQLHRQTGLVFASRETVEPAKATLLITTDHESKAVQEVGEDESYTLEVTPSGAKLHAANPLGVLRGLQTFLQWVTITPDGFSAPVVSIQDQPRFLWRGLMIDTGRHFMPLAVLERNLDGMEAVKLNVFHWHLSENQGFRVESQKYPKLHELGSGGFYYTQEEIRGLIAYARDRGIRVVPEFDMPGHSTAWFVGHPELASGTGPYQIERKWGVFDPAMDPTNEKTYKFLNEFIAEMAKLFPDAFFHIGGDEVNGKEWDANAGIQAYKKAHGLKDNNALQAYFSQRVQDLVVKHGKTPIGWDEILVPGVPKSIVIQSWRGADSLAAAAKQGYRGILSSGYYVDLGWSAARHYAVDPLGGAAANLTPEEQKLVLGGEACMWSEYVDPENIDSRIWPRSAAIAERLWSPADVRDPAAMYARLPVISQDLELVGLNHLTYQRRMIERMAGSASTEETAALRSVVEALEPVKDYTREGIGVEPTSQTPLNRVADAVSPESEASRLFSSRVDEYLASSCKDVAKASELRAQLVQWAGNDAHLRALAERSFLVKEASPASSALSQAAEVALAALDRITLGVPLSPELKKQQFDGLSALELQAHKAQLTIPALPAFQKLLEAATAGGACTIPR
ncbi:MAG TPA: family 20 glycosylhydrolase [Verrucomicrobiae bacterium]|nr:family 20 glycosylhydrolase [Verrucomicrobiae bacterium]